MASRSWRTFAECRRTLLGRRFGRLFCDSGSGVEIRVASTSAGLSIEVQVTEIVHEMFHVYAERVLREITSTKTGRVTKARRELRYYIY